MFFNLSHRVVLLFQTALLCEWVQPWFASHLNGIGPTEIPAMIARRPKYTPQGWADRRQILLLHCYYLCNFWSAWGLFKLWLLRVIHGIKCAQTDNHFIRLEPLDAFSVVSFHTFRISTVQALTAQPWVPEILVFLWLLYTSVSLLYPGCYAIRYWDLFAALLLYDYTLTISREIELFWKRPKRSRTFALFIANRYIPILGHAQFLVYSFRSPESQSDYRVRNVSWFIPYSDMQPLFWTLVVSWSRLVSLLVFHRYDTIPGVIPYISLTNLWLVSSKSLEWVRSSLPYSMFVFVTNQSHHGYACLRSLSKSPTSSDLTYHTLS